MRTAEALRLGSLVLKPLRGRVLSDDGKEGCALGMIDISGGGTVWMFSEKCTLPCDCEGPMIMGGGGDMCDMDRISTIGTTLVHLFNQHVIDGDWTIDRLAEWLDSVDPAPREHDDPRGTLVESNLDKEMSWQTKL